jgi:OTU domain-containing protein 6
MNADQPIAPAPAAESHDELKARHKKEQKDLQAKVTGLKKTATKGDKKKKKEVLAEVAQLESSLKKQQDQEEKDWIQANGDPNASSQSDQNGTTPEEEEEDDFDPNDVSDAISYFDCIEQHRREGRDHD